MMIEMPEIFQKVTERMTSLDNFSFLNSHALWLYMASQSLEVELSFFVTLRLRSKAVKTKAIVKKATKVCMLRPIEFHYIDV